MSENRNDLYSDMLTNFDIHPVKRDLVRVVNEAAVKRSIRNLLFLNKTERYFRSNVGSGIRNYLFEPMTPHTAIGLRQEVEQTLNNFEPRINLIEVTVTPDYDNNSYAIGLLFYVINKTNPVQYSISLERLR